MEPNFTTTHAQTQEPTQLDWWVPLSVATSSLIGLGVHFSSARGKISKGIIFPTLAVLLAIAAQVDKTNWTVSLNPNITLVLAPILIGALFQPLNYFIHGCIRLFFGKKFTHHRWLGLVYLTQFAIACYLYVANYEQFKNSHLVWSLPLNGVIQSCTATYYFSFLPTKPDGGYCSDRSALSFEFVAENIFFAGILLGQWLYYSDWICALPLPFMIKMILENTFVFFPYVVRVAFPKTRFRDSINDPNNKSKEQHTFWVIVTYITKGFYIWAKHYMGFFLNYVRFLDRVTPIQQYHVFGMLIFSCAATTISLFLHTLAFKHYITKRTSFILYMLSYGLTFYSWLRMLDIFVTNLDIVLLTLVGLGINFMSRNWQYGYQFVLFAAFNYQRMTS